MITKTQVLTAAAGLLDGTCYDEGEGGTESNEYVRAITELTCDLIGVPSDHKEGVLAVLKAMSE